MRKIIIMTSIASTLIGPAIGCGASSAEEQRRAVTHQNNADQAAQQGQYGVAGDEQRKAEQSHAKAVEKAFDEGRPIPRQTRPGDPRPQP